MTEEAIMSVISSVRLQKLGSGLKQYQEQNFI